MQKLIIILFIIFIPLKSFSFEKWNSTNYILEGTFASLLTIDFLQTYNGLYIDKNRTEMNPILGKKPSKKRFISYNLGILFSHTIISILLPKKFRTRWQSITIFCEAIPVIHNYRIGTRINF